MSLLFSWRSNTTAAYYAPGGEASTFYGQGDAKLGTIQATAPTGAIGTSVLDLNNSLLNSWFEFTGLGGNTPSTQDWTICYRMARGAAGTATSIDQLFQMGGNSASYFGLLTMGFNVTTDRLVMSMRNEIGQAGGTNISISVYNFSTTSFIDLVLTGRQSTSSSVTRLQCFIDGVTQNAEYTMARGINYNNISAPWSTITLGRAFNNNISTHYGNEFLIFDTVLSGASIASAFPGSSRTSFYSTTALQPINSTDPGIDNVNYGTGYTFKGDSLTGTLALANYTDPGIAQVATGTEYIYNNSTLTGTLSVPQATTSSASTVPIATIKEQIRYVLAQNNTTTGAPTQDLSANLAERVKSVLKINPEVIPLNNNAIPAVTVFTESKSPIEAKGIMVNGLSGKRRAELNMSIVGMVYAPNWINDKTNDVADDEIEYLMENVERILRAYDNLGGNVNWHFPNSVTYHSVSWDEDTHFRAGIMDLKVTLLY